jgi:HK97 family phage portal protein
MPNLLTRAWSSLIRKSNGTTLPGPYFLPYSGGWLSSEAGQYMNWWQMGYDVTGSPVTAMVEACVSAYSQTIAMLPGDHWRLKDDGGRERVTTTALSRILRFPNDYQTNSDFMLNLVRSLYLDGNAYALALRNERFEISELHLMNPRESRAQLAETGEIFYHLGGNPIIERRLTGRETQLIVPERDVLHVRLHTPRHPLIGESPLMAAAFDIANAGAMSRQQLNFYNNMARPSIVLMTEQILSAPQIEELRKRWNEQSRGLNAGGTPILAAGLKPFQLSTKAEEAQLAEVMKFTDEHIALVFRIPLQVLGIGGTPFASTEALMRLWLSTGLGFPLNHIEEAYGAMFNLAGVPKEYVELSTNELLRSNNAERIKQETDSIRGGLKTINEARAEESLPAVEGGGTIRIQQQNVPLDYWEQMMAAGKPPAKPLGGPPPQPALPKPAPPPEKAIDYRRALRASHERNSSLRTDM